MKEIVLIGNPNVGKTTLFNNLTKSNEHVGNWHGVTIDGKSKNCVVENEVFNIIDLPGLYSLSAYSFEEQISIDYLMNKKDALILNIVDGDNLNRNLFLTLELLKLKRPMLLVINETGKNNVKINKELLEKELKIKIIKINAQKKDDIIILKKYIKNNYFNFSNTFDFKGKFEFLNIENNLNKIENIINKYNIKNKEFVSYKICQNDFETIKNYKISETDENFLKELALKSFDDCYSCNFLYIKNILEKTTKQIKGFVCGKSKIDRIILNKYLTLPIFFLVLISVFYLTFFSLGSMLSKMLSNLFVNNFGSWLITFISKLTSNEIILDFFQNAIISGFGTLFSFLPQVVILFVCLGVLEQSGYLTRVAFSLDDIFSKVGLSGKGVYTLLMGFGCSTSACLTARTMEDKNSKIKTAMLAPYMSCSAKLPVYVVIGSAFFGANNVFIIFALYIFSVIVALLLSLLFEKTILKSKEKSFIMEFPKYRKISLSNILKLIYENTKLFLIRIGSLLFSINIIVWVLLNFSFSLRYVNYTGQSSMIESISKIIAPLFYPLGFGNWGAVSALVAGLIAKEIIVSTIGIVNGVSLSSGNLNSNISKSLTIASSIVFFTKSSAISFMVFCLLYSPCLATISVLNKEIGKKWTLISCSIQFVVAYLCSLFVFAIGTTIEKGGINLLLIALSFAIILGLSLKFAFKIFSKKGKCIGCKKCK